ncbi:MAG: TatD family hydrolase [bacterium]|nr:TatD family hydrolase [bacterium]
MNPSLRWVDTHCHLEMLKEPAQSALEKGTEAGLSHCLTIGTGPQSNAQVLAFCDQFPQVYGSLGIHPHQAGETTPEHLAFIGENLDHPKIVALGECGLDYHYDFSKPEEQKPLFMAQLKMAQERNMPLVIHSRQAEEDTLECLAQADQGGLRGVFHSFTSSLEMAQKVLELGFYLSFNGICTFPRSEAVREVLAKVPLDRLLLETDAPYLSPVPLRGKPNLPGNVALVGEFVAKFLGIDPQELSQLCFENSLKLFEGVNA